MDGKFRVELLSTVFVLCNEARLTILKKKIVTFFVVVLVIRLKSGIPLSELGE